MKYEAFDLGLYFEALNLKPQALKTKARDHRDRKTGGARGDMATGEGLPMCKRLFRISIGMAPML